MLNNMENFDKKVEEQLLIWGDRVFTNKLEVMVDNNIYNYRDEILEGLSDESLAKMLIILCKEFNHRKISAKKLFAMYQIKLWENHNVYK